MHVGPTLLLLINFILATIIPISHIIHTLIIYVIIVVRNSAGTFFWNSCVFFEYCSVSQLLYIWLCDIFTQKKLRQIYHATGSQMGELSIFIGIWFCLLVLNSLRWKRNKSSFSCLELFKLNLYTFLHGFINR